MRVEVRIVNAFIDGDNGGNPAGVVAEAYELSAQQKLKVAQQVGVSETAFVSQSQTATIKLEFFTPTRQIAHCGHATIAAFSLLRQLGILSEGRHSKETIDGNRDIIVTADMAFMEQRAPTYRVLSPDQENYDLALRSVGIETEQLCDALSPCVVNTGNSFLLLPLQEEAAVAAIVPKRSVIEVVSDTLDLVGYYAFSRTTRRYGRAAGARMFAPRYGIQEESATGMAAGPLACYLSDFMGVCETTVLIEQGWLMPTPSPSVIRVDLRIENDRIISLMAGGRARTVVTKIIEV